MNILCVQWFHNGEGKYNQEYYLHAETAFKRYIMLRDDIPGCDVNIEQLHVDDSLHVS